ncbi:unnamed protein product, partial [Staurois parvus]
MTAREERRAGNQHSSEGTSTLIIRALMISVAPSMPPVSFYQCHLSLPINASSQCPSVHINATYPCLPVHINATYQHPSELPFSASQCHLSVLPISATYQCQSVLPI